MRGPRETAAAPARPAVSRHGERLSFADATGGPRDTPRAAERMAFVGFGSLVACDEAAGPLIQKAD